MKKYSVKLTSIILSLVFIFSGLLSITSSADHISSKPSCVTDHFSNLTTHLIDGKVTEMVPPNMDGTCVFVAMSMLLSFYDMYWNDQFIVPITEDRDMDWEVGKYNSSSDVVLNTFYANDEYECWNKYTGGPFDFSSEHKNDYLQSYLLEISKQEYPVCGTGILASQAKKILEIYLYDTRNFSPEQVTVNILHAEVNDEFSLIPVLENLIEDGHPAIYFGASANLGLEVFTNSDMGIYGHAMIAFQSFINGDNKKDIKLHTGYSGSSPFTTVRTTEYQYVNSIIWLDINEELLPHVCENTYQDVATGKNVCSCFVYYNTHAGHCKHNFQYDNYDSTRHWRECFCEVADTKNYHSLIYSGTSSYYHIEECLFCDYHASAPHIYTGATYLSETLHNMVCECGYIGGMAYHSPGAYKPFNRFKHMVYCKCGYYFTTENHSMVNIGLEAYCKDCGAVFNASSDIVIKGID